MFLTLALHLRRGLCSKRQPSKSFTVAIQPLSTSFIKPNFHVSLSPQRSTTVSLETRNLFNAFQWPHCIICMQSQDYGAC